MSLLSEHWNYRHVPWLLNGTSLKWSLMALHKHIVFTYECITIIKTMDTLIHHPLNFLMPLVVYPFILESITKQLLIGFLLLYIREYVHFFWIAYKEKYRECVFYFFHLDSLLNMFIFKITLWHIYIYMIILWHIILYDLVIPLSLFLSGTMC